MVFRPGAARRPGRERAVSSSIETSALETTAAGTVPNVRSTRLGRAAMLMWIVVGAALILVVYLNGPDAESEALLPSPSPSTTAPSSTAPSTTAEVTTPPSTTPSTSAPSASQPVTSEAAVIAPDARPLPGNSEDLAAELSEAETMVRADDLDDSSIAAWGRRQQQLYRVMPTDPDEADRVISLVDESQRSAVENNWTARLNLSALVTSEELSATLPAWRIREPLPAAELLDYYRMAEEETGVPWQYLAAINLVETRMGRIEGLSTAGATGPMQFLPSTWAECCEGDSTVDRDAIIGAGVYLVRRGGPDDMGRALLGYNNSSRYVAAVEAYARVLEADPNAYRGYHAWQVYFLSSAGLIVLPAGYYEPEAVDAAAWLAEHPDALVAD